MLTCEQNDHMYSCSNNLKQVFIDYSLRKYIIVLCILNVVRIHLNELSVSFEMP